MKKMGGLFDAALRKEKSSLPQAWTTILQESTGLANFTWSCNTVMLATNVMNDRYFKTSSFTHSKPATTGGTMATQYYGYIAQGRTP